MLPPETASVARGEHHSRRGIEVAGPGRKNLKTLCFMPVRNADLPRSMDRYCETLSAMLERDVLGFDATALLERKRLDLVNKESRSVKQPRRASYWRR